MHGEESSEMCTAMTEGREKENKLHEESEGKKEDESGREER